MANISTVTDLVINRLSKAKYDLLCASGLLEEYLLYITDDDQAVALSNEIDNLKSDFTVLLTTMSTKLEQDDVNISYHDLKIWLSSKSHVTSVDCADFIKDGMLSTVELCSNLLVFNFNTDSQQNPVSVDLSSFVDVYVGKETPTISVEVEDGGISASIKDGSITPSLLSADAEWIFDCNHY